jgi:hypothetical protein
MLSKNQLAPTIQKEIVYFQKSVLHVAPKLEGNFYFQKSIMCHTRQLFLPKNQSRCGGIHGHGTRWITDDDINQGHLDYFWTMAAMCMLNDVCRCKHILFP